MKLSDFTLKRIVQAILLVWFVGTNAAILIPSYRLLFRKENASVLSFQPPLPPAPSKAPSAILMADSKPQAENQAQQLEAYKQQLSVYTEQIKGYTQEVTAYTQQVAAYKTQEESKNKASFLGVYEMVVKESLIVLLGGFATTLIGFVFANLGAGVVDNIMRMRNSQPPNLSRHIDEAKQRIFHAKIN